jgi:hypothetical protein
MTKCMRASAAAFSIRVPVWCFTMPAAGRAKEAKFSGKITLPTT